MALVFAQFTPLPSVAAETKETQSGKQRVTLESLLTLYGKNTNRVVTTYSLAPEWVGTVARTYLRGGGNIYGKDEPQNIRFSHTRIQEGSLSVLRMTDDGYYAGSEAPVYRADLPKLEAIVKCESGEELRKLFGASYSPTESWAGEQERVNSTVGWTYFTMTKPQQFRYLHVFAHVSQTEGMAASDIDIIEVREGLFRPADPNSAGEARKFKTANQLFEEAQAAAQVKRAKYPQPLRGLLEASEAPHDSDLVRYKAYLNSVRVAPDKKLFEQLLSYAHEDKARYGIFLEYILIDNWLKLDAWEPDKRREAILYVIDSLALTRNESALEVAIETVLRAIGGGKLHVDDPASKQRIDISVKPESTGYSMTYASMGYSPTLIKDSQIKLRAMLGSASENKREE